MTSEYFDLRIERIEGDRFRARVTDAPTYGVMSEFLNPFSPEELESLRRLVESSHRELERQAVIDWRRLPKQVGVKLFKAVFSGPVLETWREERSRTRALGQRLVVRLKLADPESETWPWEYLRDRGRFLAVSSQTPIARVPETSLSTTPLPIRPPFRILGVISSPVDCRPLAGEVEWQHLQAVLEPLKTQNLVELERLVPATLEALNARLVQADRPCHAVHFIGHGGFEWGSAEGALYFEDGSKGADPVQGEELGTILHDRNLRLAVLNACFGARGNASNPFASVAQSLIRQGVEAVIGMQYSVEDSFALSFSRLLYERLVAGESLDVAMSETRLALYSQRFKFEWGNPVLYLRSSGDIFKVESSNEDPPPPLPPSSRWKWLIRAVGILAVVALPVAVALRWDWKLPEPGTAPDSKTSTPTSTETLPTPPVTHPRCPSADGLDFKFSLIEPDELIVGSGKGSRILKVQNPICMSIYETTRSQWAEVIGSDPGSGKDLPMGDLTFNAVQKFLEKLNQRDPGGGYRLPTGDEWEYCARAGNTGDFSFGDDIGLLHEFGNCSDGPTYDGFTDLAPVGQFKPNKLGLYDMHGNAWEWVSDLAPAKRGEQPKRIRRGGSYEINARGCGAGRAAESPPDTYDDDFGFRIVRKPLPPGQNEGAAQGPPQSPQP